MHLARLLSLSGLRTHSTVLRLRIAARAEGLPVIFSPLSHPKTGCREMQNTLCCSELFITALPVQGVSKRGHNLNSFQ